MWQHAVFLCKDSAGAGAIFRILSAGRIQAKCWLSPVSMVLGTILCAMWELSIHIKKAYVICLSTSMTSSPVTPFFFSLCFNRACLLFIHQPHQAHRFLKAFEFAGPVVGTLIIHSLDMTCSLTSSMSLLKEDLRALNKSTVLLCCVLIHYYSECGAAKLFDVF